MKQQPTKDQWCLALGKLQATFDLLTTLDNADNVDRWMTLDGHIGVDWSGGPYAHEVTEEILEQLATPEMPRYIDPDELIVENNRDAGQATLRIGEVQVRMRPLNPVGADRALELTLAKMRSTLTAGAHEQDS